MAISEPALADRAESFRFPPVGHKSPSPRRHRLAANPSFGFGYQPLAKRSNPVLDIYPIIRELLAIVVPRPRAKEDRRSGTGQVDRTLIAASPVAVPRFARGPQVGGATLAAKKIHYR
jgi:hypothetical protein